MTKQELYLQLCIEAGTYNDETFDANAWYDACSHNIHSGLDDDLTLAAQGDVTALAEVRTACGLPVLTTVDEIREWLTKVPKKLLLSEVGRRNNASRRVNSGGRPKVLRPCPKCGASLSARDLAKHSCPPDLTLQVR